MDNMALVESLREKTDLTYEEAKAVLVETDWDLLDAIILAERQGRTRNVSWEPRREEADKAAEEKAEKIEEVEEKVEEKAVEGKDLAEAVEETVEAEEKREEKTDEKIEEKSDEEITVEEQESIEPTVLVLEEEIAQEVKEEIREEVKEEEVREEVKIEEAREEGAESTEKKVESTAETKGEGAWDHLKNLIKRFLEILAHNFFRVEKEEQVLISMPAWGLALALLLGWELLIPVMIVALFFGIRYSFAGRDNLDQANVFMDKASDIAGQMKSEF